MFCKSLGLDISDRSIEVLELTKGWKNIKVSSYNRQALDSGIVEDGKILQLAKLAQIISELLTKANPRAITQKKINISLPETQIFTHIFKFPLDLNEDGVVEALNYQIPEIFPFDIEDIHYDWRITHKGSSQQEVLVAAAPKVLIDSYLELFQQAKLEPQALLLESLSTAQAILPGDLNKQGALLLDLGTKTSLISIFDELGLRYSYNIPHAGQHITEDIAKELKLSEDEAEKIKIKNGLDHKQKSMDTHEIIEKSLSTIIKEVKKSIDYYEKHSQQKISKIILSGGTAKMNKLPEYLKGLLELPVIIGQPLSKIKKSDIIKPSSDEVLLANVTGLALWDLDKKYQKNSLNLLP